jgi:diguanylate cyclase (GGDEF)-like protein
MMLLEVDMDNLKQVNDLYGHSEGDRAIDIIAESLKRVAGERAECARVGGDEFWVIAYDYSVSMMEEYVKRFKVVLENMDSKEDKPYSVAVSYGSVITDPDSGITLEEYINIVDARMYRNKKEHKKNESVLLRK